MKEIGLTRGELENIEIKTNPDGFVIWVHKRGGRRWILDASLIKNTGEFELSIGERIAQNVFFKKVAEDKENNHITFRLVKSRPIKRRKIK